MYMYLLMDMDINRFTGQKKCFASSETKKKQSGKIISPPKAKDAFIVPFPSISHRINYTPLKILVTIRIRLTTFIFWSLSDGMLYLIFCVSRDLTEIYKWIPQKKRTEHVPTRKGGSSYENFVSL